MSRPLRVLLVEDSPDDAALIVRALRQGGWTPRVERVETVETMQAALEEQEWDLVLADYNLPRFSGLEALRLLKRTGRDIPFLVVTGAISEEAAVAAMKAGAHDYVMKGNLARLAPAVERELGDAENRRRRAEAEASVTALEEAARRAEKLAALGTLAAGLAHELNNPIGIMCSRIELMLMDAEASRLPPEVVADLRTIHRHAQRVSQITRNLLAFARKEPGRRAPVDLNEVVTDTLSLAARQLSGHGVEIHTALAPDLPVIEGDAGALQQVVLNLLVNAREAIDGVGTIRVETRALDRRPAVQLAVADTGHGIPPADVARIFDPFFTTKARGTGLGLSITSGIVREHRGTIDVESRPGEGTRFVLTFPLPVLGR